MIEAKVRFELIRLILKTLMTYQQQEFLRPIVTPYELEVALQEEQVWTGRYLLDFGQVLASISHPASSSPDNPDVDGDELSRRGASDEDNDEPVFSLVTGTYRHRKRYGSGGEHKSEAGLLSNAPEASDSAVVLRNQSGAVAKFPMDSAAGQFLQQRTYRGLDPRSGGDAPSVLEQGRSGIARGYQDDLQYQNYRAE